MADLIFKMLNYYINHKKNLKYYACIVFFFIFEKNLNMQDKTIDYILRYTWQAVARMYNEEATKYGATMATGFALLSIDKENGTPSTTLGPKMGMEATSLTRTLKSMEDKGLIIRKKNPADGRGVLIYLTELGKEKRELSKNTVLLFNDTVKANLSEGQLKNFFEVSEIINQLINDKKIFRDK
jgi:DNA-binding MarR family transcriptional regulator